jgi:hypothetical protein
MIEEEHKADKARILRDRLMAEALYKHEKQAMMEKKASYQKIFKEQYLQAIQQDDD